VGLIAAAVAAAAPQRPALRLVDSDPATFSGRAFKPRETVRVTFLDARAASLRVRANRYGTFTASFDGVAVDRCDQLFVRASAREAAEPPTRACPGRCASSRERPTSGRSGGVDAARLDGSLAQGAAERLREDRRLRPADVATARTLAPLDPTRV
jgi:hypothetical protein